MLVECNGKYMSFFAFHWAPSVSVCVRLWTELDVILQLSYNSPSSK